MIVRRLTADDDLSSAIHLLQRFFREEAFETDDNTIATNTKRMASIDTCGLFLAENEGKALGVATVSLEFGIEFGWSAEMGDFYVSHALDGCQQENTVIKLLIDAGRACYAFHDAYMYGT
jgi:hypothetical protein